MIEVSWENAMQWIVCMLHLNELPLRSLIEKIDGTFTSKNTLSGVIGKKLYNVETLEAIAFDPIQFTSIEMNENVKLSSDQQYLLDICIDISNGRLSDKLVNRQIGPINKVRWVTTASRILRLYATEENPSLNLQVLAHYVVFVYAPMHFEIKLHSSVVFGAIHLTKLLQSCRFLSEMSQPALDIVNKSIARNAFFAHPEHVILSMVNDERESVRLNGWQKILSARENEIPGEFRQFRVPELNFECIDYMELINLDSAAETNPSLLKDVLVTGENLDLLASKKILDHDFGDFLRDMPLHTQSVERTVQLVTKASKAVFSESNRDGYIANTLASRNSMPKFKSKQDYKQTTTRKHLSV